MAAGGSFVVGSIVAKLVLDKSGWNQSVSGVMSDAKKMGGMSASTSRAFTQVGSTLAVMGGAIVGIFGAMVKSATQWELALAQLDARLKSTGGAAGVTREAAIDLSNELQSLTTYSNDAVLEAENLLLTFTSIGKDVFPEATKTVLDMSAALGQDLKASSIQLGKALQDPVLGMSALRRVGVNFTKDQIEMVKALVKTGHSLDAQKFILRELGTEFGGSAQAAAQTFGGQMKQLKNELDDVQKEIGMAVIPVFRSLVDQIKPIVIQLKDWMTAHPELVKQIATLLLKVGGIMLALGPILIAIPRLVQLFGLLRVAVTALTGPFGIVVTALAAVGVGINKLINDHKKALDAEMGKIVQSGNTMKAAMDVRREAIKRGIIDQQEWADIVRKFGGDYTKVYNAIATDPAYAKLKTVMDEQIEASKGVKGGIEGIGAAAGGAEDPLLGLAGAISAAQKAEKEWTEFLQSAGIKTIAEKSAEIDKLLGYEDNLAQMLIDGKIDVLEYGKAVADINEKLKDLGATVIENTLPPARDLSNVLRLAAPQMEDIAYATRSFEDQLKAAGDAMGVSANTVLRELYNIRRAFLMTMGIMIPEWKDFEVAATDAATNTGDMFDALWSDVAGSFGDAVKGMLFEGDSLKEGWKGICDSMKEAVSSMIGEMVTKWVKGLLTDMVGAAQGAAAGATSAISGLASSVGSIAATIGTGITTLATALATAIGTIATGIATGLVALATGIASAATILAGAIVPIAAVGALGIALYAGFKLAGGIIDKLLGMGGDKGKGTQYLQEARNFLADINNGMIWVNKSLDVLKDIGWDISGQKFTWLYKKFDYLKIWIESEKKEICKRIDLTNKILGKLGGAAAGMIVERPSLMAVAERGPEAIVPLAQLPKLSRAAGGTTNIILRIDGQIITDREYTRTRLLPEILEALKSSVNKTRFQERLGVAG